jgi:hypothetical protein
MKNIFFLHIFINKNMMLQGMFQSAQHIYEKKEGSGTGAGSGSPTPDFSALSVANLDKSAKFNS